MNVRLVRSTVATAVGIVMVGIVLAGCGGSMATTGPKGGGTGPGATNLTTAGQSAAFLDSAHFVTSLALASGGQYLIAVVNTDTNASIAEDFTLTGTYTAGSAERVAPVPSSRALPAMRNGSRYTATAVHTGQYDAGPAVRRMQSLRKMQKNHLKMLGRNAQIFQQHRGSIRSAGGRVANMSGASISQTIGTVNKVFIAKEFGASCTDVDSIGARTVAVGAHVIVLADTNTTQWPKGLRPDSSFYQAFATEYDNITFPHITTNIGDPLAYDATLQSIGKVTVTISPVLNHFGGGIVAFVDGCDFFPIDRSNDANSDIDNFTEMFYYWTPDTAAGWNVDSTSVGGAWGSLMRATAAHETKHIVSYTDRIINNSPVFEKIWLEEGLAQESSEIWERHFSNATWKGHATFAQTVECEINLFTSGGCDPGSTKPIALLGSHLPFLFDYLEETSAAPAGHGLGTDTPSNYGAGWEFARWATDQYGSTEPSFIMSLVNEPLLNGFPNLAKHTNKSVQELLVYWNLATAVFDTVTYTAADVRTTIPSFNFGDIFFVGQSQLTCGGSPCGLFTNSGTPVFPVQPTILNATATAINAPVSGVPGTAASYFLLSAPAAGTENLELKSGSGAAIASQSGFRVGIIRIQ